MEKKDGTQSTLQSVENLWCPGGVRLFEDLLHSKQKPLAPLYVKDNFPFPQNRNEEDHLPIGMLIRLAEQSSQVSLQTLLKFYIRGNDFRLVQGK